MTAASCAEQNGAVYQRVRRWFAVAGEVRPFGLGSALATAPPRNALAGLNDVRAAVAEQERTLHGRYKGHAPPQVRGGRETRRRAVRETGLAAPAGSVHKFV